MTDRTVPNLPSRDLDRTTAFYAAFGFATTFRSDEWLILRHGDIELEFFRFDDLVPAQSSFMCSVRVDDVDAWYSRIRASGVPERATGCPRLLAVREQPWGQRAGFLVDPDGTQLHLIDSRP